MLQLMLLSEKQLASVEESEPHVRKKVMLIAVFVKERGACVI